MHFQIIRHTLRGMIVTDNLEAVGGTYSGPDGLEKAIAEAKTMNTEPGHPRQVFVSLGPGRMPTEIAARLKREGLLHPKDEADAFGSAL